nr:DUF1972 domain-containing protein [Acetatifactor muris]
MQHVFIIGSKGIPGAYGGYETFVDKLTEYHQQAVELRYHVACKNSGKEVEYHNARCFRVKVPDIGPAQAIYYDVAALKSCCIYIEKNKIEKPVIYILACRIGPFAAYFQKKVHSLGGKLYVNPDGHEWMRSKWSWPVRQYWKISERMMVKHADLLICDSQCIEKYIHERYKKYRPLTTFIAYGADMRKSMLGENDCRVSEWFGEKGLHEKGYYLIVGRFVPENNFETMIREFMSSSTKKDLVILTTDNKKFYQKLESRLHFEKDGRIKFAGTVYDGELLKKIRENAFGYIHGHEVGGTNPSLLEALASTDLNLLLDVGFNREVAQDAALYWKKDQGSLKELIDRADTLQDAEQSSVGLRAKDRVDGKYSWNLISNQYRDLWLKKIENS